MAVKAETITTADTVAWILRFNERIEEAIDHLTALDSAIGDADHGTNMARGARAVRQRLSQEEVTTPGAVLRSVGITLVSTVGGASGSLYGTFFLEAAQQLGTAETLTTVAIVEGIRSGVLGVISRGRAAVGDKTMVDALQPAVEALESAASQGASLPSALLAAAEAAERGRDDTYWLVAKRGRASYLGDRSVDHIDPGAASAALLIRALADALQEEPS